MGKENLKKVCMQLVLGCLLIIALHLLGQLKTLGENYENEMRMKELKEARYVNFCVRTQEKCKSVFHQFVVLS